MQASSELQTVRPRLLLSLAKRQESLTLGFFDANAVLAFRCFALEVASLGSCWLWVPVADARGLWKTAGGAPKVQKAIMPAVSKYGPQTRRAQLEALCRRDSKEGRDCTTSLEPGPISNIKRLVRSVLA